MCYKCWRLVSPGAASILCARCPLVAHSNCCPPTLKNDTPNLAEVCPFCMDDLRDSDQSRVDRYSSRMKAHAVRRGVVLMQALTRMFVARIAFSRGRKIVMTLQRRFRASQFWKHAFAKKVMELRPFRLRIHSLWLVVSSPGHLNLLRSDSDAAPQSSAPAPPGGTLGRRRVNIAVPSDVAKQLKLKIPPMITQSITLGTSPASMVSCS